ncbi:hypothetical protein [uncultured Kordia sp.]|uniref:hypothetical protein n=1 Tax=uncultured Kordia sp. TaxID=507699 RepID=UPI00262FFAB9|nr:hypothetical protein [uncultured Kordia sp.]
MTQNNTQDKEYHLGGIVTFIVGIAGLFLGLDFTNNHWVGGVIGFIIGVIIGSVLESIVARIIFFVIGVIIIVLRRELISNIFEALLGLFS